MKTTIRKFGNSIGIILPSTLAKSLNLFVGQQMDLEVLDGNLLIKTHKKRRTLKQLVDQCDLNAPFPSEISNWEKMPSVKNETIK